MTSTAEFEGTLAYKLHSGLPGRPEDASARQIFERSNRFSVSMLERGEVTGREQRDRGMVLRTIIELRSTKEMGARSSDIQNR